MNVLKVLFDGSPPQLKTLTMCFVRKKKKKKSGKGRNMCRFIPFPFISNDFCTDNYPQLVR